MIQNHLYLDGLALVRRGGESLLNEPHAGGGSPVLSSSGTAYFSDILGTTLGEKGRGRGYAAARQTAFGEGDAAYFTGKPAVAGLGRAFLLRNYRPDLAKWQIADPLGYPDGWNQLAYCGNEVIDAVDIEGCWKFVLTGSDKYENKVIVGTRGWNPKDKKDIYIDYAEISGSISAVGNFTQQLIYSFTSTVSFKDTDSKIDSSLSLSYKVILAVDDEGGVSVRIDGDTFVTKDKSRLDFTSYGFNAKMLGSYVSDALSRRISGNVVIPNYKVVE